MKKEAAAVIKATIKVNIARLGLISRAVFPPLYYIIIIVTISGIAAAFFAASYFKTPGKLPVAKTIIIAPGSSLFSIGNQLGSENIIELPQLFTIIVKLAKSGQILQAGEYNFPANISPIEVFEKIAKGDVVVRKMTIPEGLSTFFILEMIKKDPAQKGPMPENIGEGTLLPETYEYHYGDVRANMVKRMQEAMHSTIDALWEQRQPNLPLNNKQEALILASIIEKETGISQERPQVAAVFINRLRINMRLQTDPSVIYAITKGQYMLDRPLSHKDLAIDSNYNTYKNAGLPPTAIANPGRASIEAALNPATTEDIYFVATGTGGHVFAKTLKQHNENVKKLRLIEKEAQN